MAVPARAVRALNQVLGDEAADDMVNWMHGVETSRSDLRELTDLIVQRNDARIDARFAEYDRKLDVRFAEHDRKLDARFAAIDGRFAQIDERFSQIDERFRQIDERFRQIDMRFEQIDLRFTQIEARFASLEQKVSAFDGKIEQKFAELLKWSFVFWIGTVGAMVAIAGFLR